MIEREHCFGIYMFKDKKTGDVVYIGKDSHIDVQERIKAHYRPSTYDSQQFNRVLQNNRDRYEPFVYCRVDNVDDLNRLEFDLINLYRPKFNYKHGGQGRFINKDFEYTVVKCGLRDGKQNYSIQSMFRKSLIQSIDYDFLNDICQKLNRGDLTPDEVKQIERKIVQPLKSNLKRSKSNSSGFYRVRKMKDETCKQGYLWAYEFYDENNNHKKIHRVDFFKLKKEVEKRKMVWSIVDLDKAINTIRSMCTGF